eukprot:429599_1
MSSNTTCTLAKATIKEMMTNFDRLNQLVSDLRNNVQQLQRKQCEILSHIHVHIPSKSKNCPCKPVVNHNINCPIVKEHEELKSDHKEGMYVEYNKKIHTNSRANPPIIQPQIHAAMDEVDEKTLQHTTPELNAKPIPPDTEEGRRQLTVNLQLKMNAMHVIDAYKGADEIPNAMSLMEAGLYGAMVTAWESLINLENKTIKQIESNKINKRNDIKMQNADALLARSVHQLRSQPPIKQILNVNRFNERVEAVAIGLNDNVDDIDKDEHGLPILPDQSKYKAVALEFCHKIRYTKPTIGRHPKSEFLEWCQEHGKARPEAKYEEFSDPSSNLREWTCRVEWNSMIFRHKAGNKKEAEKECYRKLLCYVMNSASG